ncbi:unnamed protein product [Dibothriocephalus latus]|uniref:Uncharacterized protein n=1 Tax=Dibothriocephalus latus TaxID=60516 RepID=A0A3P7L4M8_DIBLA|nr:unnamed protein product [Dibothriocephalus latus]
MDNVDLTLYDGLIEEELENETWKVCLTIVVPHQAFDEELVIGFSKAVLLGHRKSIVSVSLETLLSEAKLYGTAVAKKARGAPKFTEICDVIKNRSETNQPFPAALLALLIKFHLIRIRNQGQQQKSKEPGRVATVRQKKKNPKRPTSSQSELEPPSAKEPSKMRKHGDEPDVDKETDDERNNGITQYILLTGFYDPKIIEELISVGVSVHNIIKISVAEEAALKHLVQRKLQEKTSLLPVGQVAEAEKVAECQRTEKQKALNRFWEKLEEELDFQFASGRLRDVVALNYIVRPQMLPDSLSDEQAVVDCGKVIYDELLAIIYDLVDFRRQWQNYLAHIKLFAIPRLPESQRRPSRDPADTSRQSNSGASKAKNSIVDDDFVEMSTYNCILKDYALENIQPELILHAILEQVVESESIEEKVVERLLSMPEKAVKHISVTVKSLLFEDQQLQVRHCRSSTWKTNF